ncbi:hypothetical protein VYU27_005341 [Nannochloropsis oceanica]
MSWWWWWQSSAAERLRRKAAAKRLQCDAQSALPLPPLAPGLTAAKENEIAVASTVEELVTRVKAGTLSSYEVVSVMVKRAREFGGVKGVNAVTEEFYDGALTEARQKDRQLALTRPGCSSKNLGLLEGMPISIKDHINVKGKDSTTGAACRCFQPVLQDALVVELLRDAGAIILCKTNVPQCLMLPETTNNIWGTTVTPWDLRRTAGGSSGGEAALIAARGSLLGVGTDIGGSCRVPAMFSGCVGFKPTPARVSDQGLTMPFPGGKIGMKAVKVTAGPLANRVEDVALMCEAWWVEKMWLRDPFVVPLPFDHIAYREGLDKTQQRQQEEKEPQQGCGGGLAHAKKFRLGWFMTDDFFEPSRAGKRAMGLAKQALEATGKYELVELKLDKSTNGWEAVRLFYNILTAEGGMKSYVEGLEGEPLIGAYRKMHFATSLWDWVRPFMNCVLYLLDEKRMRFMVKGFRREGVPTRDYWQYCKELQVYQEAWVHMLHAQDLQGFLCPGVALPAFCNGASQSVESACTYTFFLNLLHFPAGMVPVTRVREDEACYPLKELPRMQRDSIARAAAKTMQGSAGLPVGVQVAFLPFQDEMCLHVMKDLQDAVKFRDLPALAKRRLF